MKIRVSCSVLSVITANIKSEEIRNEEV